MSLLLVQHGKSLSKEVDPEQGLSDEGRSESEEVASTAETRGLRIVRILHSGKKRAAQTAEIFASKLHPAGGVQMMDGLNSRDNVSSFAEKINASENLMLIGHLHLVKMNCL